MLDILSKRVEHPFLEKTEKALEEFSTTGLRTLVFGYRVFSEKQFNNIMKVYKDAVKAMERKQKMALICRILEDDLILLGCTAIRDHLQEKVHESITRFIEANIKVWMITGDKLQTAESIGYSAGILQPTMRVFEFDQSEHKSKEEFPKMVLDLKRRMQRVKAGVKKAIVVDISNNSRSSSYLRFYLQ